MLSVYPTLASGREDDKRLGNRELLNCSFAPMHLCLDSTGLQFYRGIRQSLIYDISTEPAPPFYIVGPYYSKGLCTRILQAEEPIDGTDSPHRIVGPADDIKGSC